MRAALRGGNWNNGSNARAGFALNLNNPPSNTNINIGFRAASPNCARRRGPIGITSLFRDHYWLLAEAVLHERQFDSRPTGQVDEHGQPIMAIVERPLDLTDVQITVFPLPEVE